MILLITYKLAGNLDYTPLYNAIKGGHASTWWHYIDNTWMVKTTETPAQMIDRLTPHINGAIDSILIIKVDGHSYNGWLPSKAYDWIKENR